MLTLRNVKEIAFLGNLAIKNKWDFPVCITGREGVGKSNLNLWIAHFYRIFSNLKILARQITLTIDPFIELFVRSAEEPRGYFMSLDEGGNLYNRDSNSKFNKAITKALMIVRAKGFFMTFCVPSFELLDKGVRRRIRLLCHVYERGKFAFWCDEMKLRMIEQEVAKTGGHVMNVEPDGYGTYPEYNGDLLPNYDVVKNAAMNETLTELGYLLPKESQYHPKTAAVMEYLDVLRQIEAENRNLTVKQRIKLYTAQTGRGRTAYFEDRVAAGIVSKTVRKRTKRGLPHNRRQKVKKSAVRTNSGHRTAKTKKRGTK